MLNYIFSVEKSDARLFIFDIFIPFFQFVSLVVFDFYPCSFSPAVSNNEMAEGRFVSAKLRVGAHISYGELKVNSSNAHWTEINAVIFIFVFWYESYSVKNTIYNVLCLLNIQFFTIKCNMHNRLSVLYQTTLSFHTNEKFYYYLWIRKQNTKD